MVFLRKGRKNVNKRGSKCRFAGYEGWGVSACSKLKFSLQHEFSLGFPPLAAGGLGNCRHEETNPSEHPATIPADLNLDYSLP